VIAFVEVARRGEAEREVDREATMQEILESDWKVLRQLKTVVLERFCENILSEIAAIHRDSAKSFLQRYLDVYEVMRRRDKEIAQVFDGIGRSSALMHLAAMKARGLMTEEEFLQFGAETQSFVTQLLRIRS
jgi:hypothetical protein